MKYLLRCQGCGGLQEDRLQNQCREGHEALLVTEYGKRRLELRELPGMWKFLEWLPCEAPLPHGGEAITYRSEGLSRELGLPHLYLSFSGYWPERGARLKSCSFKELEAAGVLARTRGRTRKILVLASAGNTGRAFAALSQTVPFPVVAVVPEPHLHRMWTVEEPSPRFLLLSVRGEYQDAIRWASRISTLEGTLSEGGARNVGRRDGIGTLLLSAVLEMGRLPDHYFQAVGSGVGALAVWEASRRLQADGRFGSRLPRLHLSQNLPFAPMFRAWREGRRELLPQDFPEPGKEREIHATVLSTRSPPYSLAGGVYDALHQTGGRMYGITNREAREAQKLAEEVVGIDLDPAASVAVASLLQATEEGEVGREDLVLLNLTGGGYERIREDHPVHPLSPSLTLKEDTSLEEVEELLKEAHLAG